MPIPGPCTASFEDYGQREIFLPGRRVKVQKSMRSSELNSFRGTAPSPSLPHEREASPWDVWLAFLEPALSTGSEDGSGHLS